MDYKAIATATIAQYGQIVDQIDAGAWKNATPCSEWDLRKLVNHVTGEVLWIPDILAGKTIEEVGKKYDGDVLGTDPKATRRQAASAATDAINKLTDLKATVHLSYGDVMSEVYLTHMIIDGVIHAWDTAKGAQLDYQLKPELVEACSKLFQEEAPLWRAAGILGPQVQVADSADTLTKLLGLAGRDVNWTKD